VLVEGYKREPIPKLEVYRAEVGEPLIHPHDEHVVAIATDTPLDTALPQLDLNAPAEIAEFVLKHVGLARSAPGAG
jgi:molybdopterin-guanine dinucleotide biosynthesis protein B